MFKFRMGKKVKISFFIFSMVIISVIDVVSVCVNDSLNYLMIIEEKHATEEDAQVHSGYKEFTFRESPNFIKQPLINTTQTIVIPSFLLSNKGKPTTQEVDIPPELI